MKTLLNTNPLFDSNFLNDLMKYRQRETFARISLLDQNEFPIKYIEGKVTGGSVNIDGASALRRTCNLTMVLENQEEINEFDWTFKSKFSLEIGIKNFINSNYPDIIWFKQGIFIITTCNMSQTTNNYTISITGKDKMCLLNGDLGGVIPHATNFGEEEYLDASTGEVTKNKIPLKDIIRNALMTFGGEKPENIIINNLDEVGLELMEYAYEEPLYLFRNKTNSTVDQCTLNGEEEIWLPKEGTKPIQFSISSTLSQIDKYYQISGLIEEEATIFKLTNNINDIYQAIKIQNGDLVGYRMTDLTYAGDLTANIGDTLVSVFDKIKNMLGNFEYFYNIDGRFVFQRKFTYVSTPWGGVEENTEDFVNSKINDSFPKINLLNGELITSFGNNPNLLNVRNDFSVWGNYKGMNDSDIPIHMRYAIDIKPTDYKPIRSLWTREENPQEEAPKDYIYFSSLKDKKNNPVIEDKTENGITSSYFKSSLFTISGADYDWREIIYQMALDYYKCGQDEDFRIRLAKENPQYPLGYTGYEQYYVDMQGFWRQLYDPNPDAIYEEIDATMANQIDINKLYVESYYAPIEKSKFKKDNKMLPKEDWPCTIDNLYIIMPNTIKNNQGQEITKYTFYPFVGSEECHLELGTEYWYYNGKDYIKTQNNEILNMKNLNEIYVEGSNNTKKLFSTQQLESFIDKSGTTLWVKQEGKILFNNLDNRCKKIYRGGKNTWQNDPLTQYLTNWFISDNYGTLSTSLETTDKITYLLKNDNGDYDSNYWHKNVKEDPSSLYFWFDFLETEGSDLYKYSVKEIGPRPKAINDSNVKAIYYRDVPNIIFKEFETNEAVPSGYTYINVPTAYRSLFRESAKGKSAKERIDELLQDHSCVAEQANITMIPLYNLAPNTRISIFDEKSKINGEYIVTKFNIPLTYNGTMNLQTTKVVSNIV